MRNKIRKNQEVSYKKFNLIGSPEEVGKKYGNIICSAIKISLRFFKKQAKRRGIMWEQLLDRANQFQTVLEKVAPSWLEETKSIAQACGTNVKDLLAINSLPPHFWDKDFSSNCTSFMAIGKASKSGESLLHKNRDERNFHQNVYVKKVADSYRYIAGGDIGNIGIAHFLNEKGLAGANNTGSKLKTRINNIGLSDCHIMRLFAEKASSCQDALRIIEEIIKRGFCGTAGKERGMIFLLVDKGEGLIIENTCTDFSYQWITDGVAVRSNHFLLPKMCRYTKEGPDKNSLTRYKCASKLVCSNYSKITPENLQDISRNHTAGSDSICNDNKTHFWMTLSAFTNVIRKRYTDILSLSWICNGHPHNCFYFPFHVGTKGNLVSLVNGEANGISLRLYQNKGCGYHLQKKQKRVEKESRLKTTRLEEQVATFLKKGKREEARDLVAKVDITMAEKMFKYLEVQ